MEKLDNEIMFYELLKTNYPSKIHTSFINVNLGALDNVLSCIDECQKIDIENSQEIIKSFLLKWKENNYSSLNKNIDTFLDQIIWLNNILKKRTYSADYLKFKTLYDYPSDSENNLQDYYFNLKGVSSDGVIIFEYNADSSNTKPLTYVSAENLINILRDLFLVKTKLREQNNKYEGKLKIINEKFNDTIGVDCYAFFQDKADYTLFSDLLANYLTYGTYKTTDRTIVIKPKVKGKLTIILKSIHQTSTNYGNFSEDYKYHKLLKILSTYKDRSTKQLIEDFRR